MDDNNKKVLVIEDESILLDAIVRALGELDVLVFTAKDGAEGLRSALSNHPDLILLDVVLPSMDGMTVLENLRKDEWGKDVAVIILTNLSKTSILEEGEKHGVRDYMVKTDWKISEVIEKVKKELGLS
jgi:two-component system, OmpR family, alkaline phosphatase synthesis response regulator PhoP